MGPSLVLLPGMDGTGELFGPLVSALGADFKATIVKYPTEKLLSYVDLTKLPKAALKPFERFPQRWLVRDLDGPHLILQVVPENAAKEIREFVARLTVPAL